MSGLRPFFSFYGGKWRLAPKYPEPEEHTIIEPFAGSAGYSVRHPEYRVKLYDLDEKVIGAWQYLLKVSSAEIYALPLIHPGQTVADLNVCQEAGWLIGLWLNKATNRPRNSLSAWARDPRYARQFWGPEIRDRLAAQVDSIRHWTAEQSPYEAIPDCRATWFVDPPYSGPAGARYVLNNATIDFGKLGDWCQSRSGQVLVCENEGADWLPFQPLTRAKATSGRGRTGVSHEVLWVRDR